MLPFLGKLEGKSSGDWKLMTEIPKGALPRGNTPAHLPWRVAASVAFSAIAGELLTHLLVRHLADWLVHVISLCVLVLVFMLLFRRSLHRQAERAAKEAGAENLLSTEIDNRRRAEHMLRERTQLLDTLVQTSPVGIIVHDENRVVTVANPSFCEIFGYSPEECLGRKVEELIVQPGAEDAFLTNIQRIAEGAVFQGS